MPHTRGRSADPTRTTTIRKKYAQHMRGRYERLSRTIRTAIVDRDIFGLRERDRRRRNAHDDDDDDDERDRWGRAATEAGWRRAGDPEIDEPATYRHRSDAEKVDAFMRWLEAQEQQAVNDRIEKKRNPYIKAAYERGLETADRELTARGINWQTAPTEELLRRSGHKEALEMLYTKNYRAAWGISDEVNKEVARILTRGFAAGWNPERTADEIAKQIDSIGKQRATVMARTETVNAHTEATLSRYEEINIEKVTVEAELQTAGDDRVCEICQSVEGEVVDIQEARRNVFHFDGEDYDFAPPIHPQCRCVIVPEIVSKDIITRLKPREDGDGDGEADDTTVQIDDDDDIDVDEGTQTHWRDPRDA